MFADSDVPKKCVKSTNAKPIYLHYIIKSEQDQICKWSTTQTYTHTHTHRIQHFINSTNKQAYLKLSIKQTSTYTHTHTHTGSITNC